MNISLTFSDSAKYAQAAKNLVEGRGLTVTHSFFDPNLLASFSPGTGFPGSFKTLTSFILALMFRFLPINDATVAYTGIFFFALSALLVFLITKKLSSTVPAIVAVTFFVLNHFFIEYAFNFSTEILFIFEALLFAYFVLQSSWIIKALSLIPIALMFITRPQGSIFLLAIVLSFITYYLLITPNIKRLIKSPFAVIFATFLVLATVYVFKTPGLSPLNHIGALNIATGTPQGVYLRGVGYPVLGIKGIVVKTFYNLYNYLRNLDRLASPIIFFLFLLSFLVKRRDHPFLAFRVFSFWALVIFVGVASATLPNARYVHPVLPFVYICSSIFLYYIINRFYKAHTSFVVIFLSFFILIPEIGFFTLDARFRNDQFNTSKPRAYQEISRIMALSIPQGHLVITNLDAWAAWYQNLTTMWFPISPNLLKDYVDKVDYIVITNYKENEGDFAIGEWKEVVYTPNNLQNEFLRENYHPLTTFSIPANSVYENQGYKGTILVRNDLKN